MDQRHFQNLPRCRCFHHQRQSPFNSLYFGLCTHWSPQHGFVLEVSSGFGHRLISHAVLKVPRAYLVPKGMVVELDRGLWHHKWHTSLWHAIYIMIIHVVHAQMSLVLMFPAKTLGLQLQTLDYMNIYYCDLWGFRVQSVGKCLHLINKCFFFEYFEIW